MTSNNKYVSLIMAVLTVLTIAYFEVAIHNKEEVSYDPVYNQAILSEEPFIVYQVRVGGGEIPDLYQVWYNPMTEEYTDFILKGEK